MSAMRPFLLVPCVILMTSAVAFGQQARVSPQGSPFQRGYMTGAAGASFGDQQAATFGVEIGEHINRHVQAYATFTYFDNLFNDAAQDDLDILAVQLGQLTATPWEFQGRDRGLAFSGGAKYLLADGASVRPYVGGGPGVLNIRRTITEQSLGDVSDPVIAVFGAPDGVIDAAKTSTYKPMAEFLAGVGIAAGRTYVDMGYRFRKVFRSSEAFTFSQFNVGVGMRF